MSGLGSISSPLLCIVDVKTEVPVYSSECSEGECSTRQFLPFHFLIDNSCFRAFFFNICSEVSCWKPCVYTCQSECGLQSSVAMPSAHSIGMDYFQTVTYTDHTHTHKVTQTHSWCSFELLSSQGTDLTLHTTALRSASLVVYLFVSVHCTWIMKVMDFALSSTRQKFQRITRNFTSKYACLKHPKKQRQISNFLVANRKAKKSSHLLMLQKLRIWVQRSAVHTNIKYVKNVTYKMLRTWPVDETVFILKLVNRGHQCMAQGQHVAHRTPWVACSKIHNFFPKMAKTKTTHFHWEFKMLCLTVAAKRSLSFIDSHCAPVLPM